MQYCEVRKVVWVFQAPLPRRSSLCRCVRLSGGSFDLALGVSTLHGVIRPFAGLFNLASSRLNTHWADFVVRRQQGNDKKKAMNRLCCLATYLTGLPHHGSPLSFHTCLQLILPPEIYQHRWPTSFAGRETPGGDEFGCKEA